MRQVQHFCYGWHLAVASVATCGRVVGRSATTWTVNVLRQVANVTQTVKYLTILDYLTQDIEIILIFNEFLMTISVYDIF